MSGDLFRFRMLGHGHIPAFHRRYEEFQVGSYLMERCKHSGQAWTSGNDRRSCLEAMSHVWLLSLTLKYLKKGRIQEGRYYHIIVGYIQWRYKTIWYGLIRCVLNGPVSLHESIVYDWHAKHFNPKWLKQTSFRKVLPRKLRCLPENQWLEDVFPPWNSPFLGGLLVFGGLRKKTFPTLCQIKALIEWNLVRRRVTFSRWIFRSPEVEKID